MKKKSEKFKSGFTLIELLVVVAIIGILSAVVVSSLSSAREKGKIAMIKSTLKNIQSQAEIVYTETGSYSSLFNSTTLDCIGSLSGMAQSLTDKGVFVKCYSRNSSSLNDVYLRFGATAIIYSTTSLKAWSVDQNGLVAWDQMGVNNLGQPVNPDTYIGMTWAVSNTACSTYGARLPSLEHLYTLTKAFYAATGNISYLPTGMIADAYWTSTQVPSTPTSSYYVRMSDSYVSPYPNTSNGPYVRCVR